MLKVREAVYTHILTTVRVDVNQLHQHKQMVEHAIEIQKKYEKACSYQKEKNLEEARKLFKELCIENYKDSSQRFQQVQNEIDKILLDPDKPSKIQKLREEYKKYTTITFTLAIIFAFVNIVLDTSALSIFPFFGILRMTLWFLAIGYILMYSAFRKKVKSDKALNDVYLNVMAMGHNPSNRFKTLTCCIAIISGILGIIIIIASSGA